MEYKQNASNLHKKIGDLLTAPNSPFSGFQIYQEMPVSKINIFYSNNTHKFDWVIPQLFLIIEAHGEQHYNLVSFSNNKEDSLERLKTQKFRDMQKMQAAVDMGYTYIEIPYTDYKILDLDYIIKVYKLYKNLEPVEVQTADSTVKRRELAKKQYKRYKENKRKEE